MPLIPTKNTTENSRNETNQGNEATNAKAATKNRSSFARDRLSNATVLSGESNTNETAVERPPHPFENASLLSKMLFIWPLKLMTGASDGSLDESDLPDVLNEDSSGENLYKFNVMWMAEKRRAAEIMEQHEQSKRGLPAPKSAYPSLRRAFMKDYVSSLWFIQPIMFALSTAKLLQAVALGKLLKALESRTGTYVWACLLVLGAVVMFMTNHQVYFWTWRKGMQYRIATIAAIYDKTLLLKSTTSSHNSGTMTNLASNDVDRFLMASAFGPYLIWGPIQVLAIPVVGSFVIGWSFAVGIAFLVFVIVPVQLKWSKKLGAMRSKTAQYTDERMAHVSQALSGIRVAKMMGWEENFEQRITSCRKLEVDWIKGANSYRAMNDALFFAINIFVSLLIFLIHVFSGGTLTLTSVYTTIVLINAIQYEIRYLAMAVIGLSECTVSLGRIQKFIESPILAPRKDDSLVANCNPNAAIVVSNATCHWNSDDIATLSTTSTRSGSVPNDDIEAGVETDLNVALDKINLEFELGQLTCVIGEVGSGKSALIQMLAGELPPLSGTINRNQDCAIAYAPQDPWIMDGSVRENILLGRPLNTEFYDSIVNACGLNVDFAQLRNGEDTIVGDQGVQLSGGQRARIALARAFYCDADILLLDDPLSAVDSKVGRLLFYSAIQDLGLKRGKCIVLVTHQHQFIGDSRCVLMKAGSIACTGSYQKCVEESGGKLGFALQVKETNSEDTSKSPALIEDKAGVSVQENHTSSDGVKSQESSTPSNSEQKEKIKSGIVKRETFLNYLRAMPGGLWTGLFMLFLFIATQGSVMVTVAAIGKWSGLPADEQDSGDIIGVVVGLVFAASLLFVLRSFSSLFLTAESSRRLHDQMLKSVLRSKVDFFDVSPLGRILNRFSSDVGSIDDQLPAAIMDCIYCFSIVLGAIISTVSLLPMTLAAVPPLVVCFLKLKGTFMRTSRDLKRLDGAARSPIFAMLSESLSGIATIRTNNAIWYFQQKFREVHDSHGRIFFAFLACSRWLAFWLDALMVLFLTAASFVAVVACDLEWFNIDPSVLGLAFALLVQSVYVFGWAIRQSAEVVNHMVAVERVCEYSELPSEAAFENDFDKSVSDWPSTGDIDVQSLSVRYRSGLPLSLRDLTFRIEGGSRVGVVGRTGGGKSTLVQSLLRLLEAESGQILVDGVDISKLGLHKLRRGISVIPQSPTLYGGSTIRENLDPFQHHCDEQIKEALLYANMLPAVLEQPLELDTIVSDGGSNFSVGQRQLLCLARAILCKNKILVLDEPTANVDSNTDKLLQETVKENFDGATIISVAHRLDTVIDYDKILVLGSGSVLEYGSPYELIQKGGAFASMVRDTGDEMSEYLAARAQCFASSSNE